MKTIMLLTGGGALVILTSYQSATDRGLREKLKNKGIEKFVSFEIPLDLARERYGARFSVIESDLHESDDLRVLDYNADRAFRLFRFDELGPPVVFEPQADGAESAERPAAVTAEPPKPVFRPT